jgi:hydroxymethylbilane synthase
VPGLALVASPPRGPAGDLFLSQRHPSFDRLPHGATVATGSLRRRAQVLNRRPDLNLVEIRGNIDTRLRKLESQELDALILAEAGLARLGLSAPFMEVLDPAWMLRAVGQGALGLECRADDGETVHLVEALNDPDTWAAVTAERAMLLALGGGCTMPIGAAGRVADGVLTLRGTVLSPDGRLRLVASSSGPVESARAVGGELAADLLTAGARELLAPAAGG